MFKKNPLGRTFSICLKHTKHTYYLLFSFNCLFSILWSPESAVSSFSYLPVMAPCFLWVLVFLLWAHALRNFIYESFLMTDLKIYSFRKNFNLFLTGTLGYLQCLMLPSKQRGSEISKFIICRPIASFRPHWALWILFFYSSFGLLRFYFIANSMMYLIYLIFYSKVKNRYRILLKNI